MFLRSDLQREGGAILFGTFDHTSSQAMKRVIVTLAMLGTALAQGDGSEAGSAVAVATGAATGGAGAVQPALDLITEAMAKTKAAAASEKALCTAEQKSTQEWHDLVNSPESLAEIKEAREGRKAAKRELAAALGKRLKVLQEFLEKLYQARQRLGTHIHRVNDIFQDVYTAVTDAQVDAAEVIKLLGISLAQPHSPLFKPIKLPKKDKMDMEGEQAAAEEGVAGSADAAAAAASGSLLPGVPTPQAEDIETAPADAGGAAPVADGADGADAVEVAQANADAAQAEEQAKEDSGEPADSSLASATSLSSFMELEARVATHVAGCEGADCNAAYTQAFGLYKYTYGVNKGNSVHFEKERASLGG